MGPGFRRGIHTNYIEAFYKAANLLTMLRVAHILALICLLSLTACAGAQRNLDVAPGGEQSLIMWHKPSGERISVVYRVNGHYDPQAFSEIDHIFRDRRTGEEYPIDPALIDAITDLRDKMMLGPESPIELTSGYRSSESNDILRTTNKNAAKNSYHTRGMAADIRMADMNAHVMELVAKTMQRGGVALYPDNGHVHVDVGPVRGWEVKRGREDGGGAQSRYEEMPRPQPKPVLVRSSAKGARVPVMTAPSPTPTVTRGVTHLPPVTPKAIMHKPLKPAGKAVPAPAAPPKAAPPAAKPAFKKLTKPVTPTRSYRPGASLPKAVAKKPAKSTAKTPAAAPRPGAAQ